MSSNIIKLIASTWRPLRIPPNELRLHITLNCGQVFRWRPFTPTSKTNFVGIIDSIPIELKETNEDILYRRFYSQKDDSFDYEEYEKKILSYFHLDKSMVEMNKLFSERDELYKSIYNYFPGIRVIRQDPFECLISFICSSNNNISRISLMLDRLCKKFGNYIGSYEENDIKHEFYDFPTLHQLQAATIQDLKELGFGYRAKYVIETVKKLKELQQEHGENYLLNLRNEKDSEKILSKLTQFTGVGLKVASCIALFSLDVYDCVPVDVHMLRVARSCYVNHPRCKQKITDDSESLTPIRAKKYMQVFKDVFGEYCGWAQMVLYSAQLASNKHLIPEEIYQKIRGTTKRENENDNRKRVVKRRKK